MIALIIAVVVTLFIAASISPNRSNLSEFELRRRLDEKRPETLLEWRRGELYTELMTLRRIVIAFLLVVASALIIARFGWVWGLIGAFVLTLSYNRVAAIGAISKIAQARYDHREPALLEWIDKHRNWIRPFRGVADSPREVKLASREELVHIAEAADDGILTKREKHMVKGALSFADKKVKDYMTPRSAMEVIGVNELLGPLVLDDLHKTGHSHFPVMDGDLDHIVGILHLHNILTLINKRSVTVGEVMEPKVMYINENQPLHDVLSVCIKHRRHLLVVVNELRETVGVITIEDAVVQLIGEPIVDERDDHDNLKKVAERFSSDKS